MLPAPRAPGGDHEEPMMSDPTSPPTPERTDKRRVPPVPTEPQKGYWGGHAPSEEVPETPAE